MFITFRALAIIHDRAIQHPSYQRAAHEVARLVEADTRGADVATMRRLGGWTEIIRRHATALADSPGMTDEIGSRLCPMQVRDVFMQLRGPMSCLAIRHAVAALRGDAAGRLAKVKP